MEYSNKMESFANFENNAALPLAQDLVEDRVEALRALVGLMQREVESLEKTFVSAGAGEFGEHRFCLQNEVQRYEADLIRSALVKTGGRQRHAARLLGVKVTTLNAKIKKYDISWRVIGVESEFVA